MVQFRRIVLKIWLKLFDRLHFIIESKLPVHSFQYAAHTAISFLLTFADAPLISSRLIPQVTLTSIAHPGLLICDTFSVVKMTQ